MGETGGHDPRCYHRRHGDARLDVRPAAVAGSWYPGIAAQHEYLDAAAGDT
jgi:hypothetical protein